jgi:inner membrane protein
MNPATHFLAGWLIANADDLPRRDRALVTAAAVIPDLDGLGILAHAFTSEQAGWAFYSQYHHVVAHNVFFGLTLTAAVFALATKRGLAALLALIGFHIHLLMDILSGRGPDGTIWTIAYLHPLYANLRLYWPGQWELDAWPNVVVTAVFLTATLYLAWRRGFSPVGLFSVAADRAIVTSLRNRFPR